MLLYFKEFSEFILRMVGQMIDYKISIHNLFYRISKIIF